MRAALTVLLAVVACRNIGEPAPRLAITPPALAFAGVAGGIGPPRQAIIVDAIGGGTLQWVASADVPWVSMSPPRATAPSLVWVVADITGLAAGSYEGRITVAGTSENGMKATIAVTLALGSAASLSGRWAGGKDTVALSLSLAQMDTLLTGSGTLNPPLQTVGVTGSFRDPGVRLTLTAADSSVTTFIGSLVDKNTMKGLLNGGRISNVQVTIFRQ